MAELNKLLAFMSSWDRQATLDRYEAMFDEGGDPEAVMEELGSPTKVAVELAKDYISSPPPGEAVARDEPEIEVISLEQLLAEEDADISLTVDPLPAELLPVDSLPVEPPPAEPLPAEAIPVETFPAETPEPPVPAKAEAPAAPVTGEPPETAPDEPGKPDRSTPVAPAPEPIRWDPPAPEKAGGGAAMTVYWVLAVLIGLPVALALVCVGLPFPVAGVVIIARTIRTVPALFGSFKLLSDVLLVAGVGVVRLAAGLLLIWFGVWLSLTLCRLWIFKLILPLGRRIRDEKEARET